jgi:hypothetical protein
MGKGRPKGMFVMLFVLQGKPRIILDEELENPHVWGSLDEAMAFTTSGQLGVTAAEQIIIVDCNSGETEVL